MKTLQDFQSDVAKKYKLGTKLVTGHLKKYYDEASLEFAKYHVEQAKSEIANASNMWYGNHKDDILNLYPLTNIK